MENLNNITKILLDIDDDLCGAEIATEKSKFQIMQLCEVLLMFKTENEKINAWESCRIMSGILSDYVFETEKRLEAVRENYNVLWNQTKKPGVETVQKQAGRNTNTEADYKEKIKQLVEVMDKEDLRRLWLIGEAMTSCKE